MMWHFFFHSLLHRLTVTVGIKINLAIIHLNRKNCTKYALRSHWTNINTANTLENNKNSCTKIRDGRTRNCSGIRPTTVTWRCFTWAITRSGNRMSCCTIVPRTSTTTAAHRCWCIRRAWWYGCRRRILKRSVCWTSPIGRTINSNVRWCWAPGYSMA